MLIYFKVHWTIKFNLSLIYLDESRQELEKYGWSFSNNFESTVINLERYINWTKHNSKGDIFTPRTGHSVAVFNDMLYLFGGSEVNTLLNDFYEYSMTNDTWKKLEISGKIPSPRSGTKSCVCQGKIYYYGGYTQVKLFFLNLSY